jgi:proteasome lid subunit RPN8/RPN11
MSIHLPRHLLNEIHCQGENAYPEEGAGLLLGHEQDGFRYVQSLLILENAREDTARHNRYLITAADMLGGEKEAERRGQSIIGIYHSHPDHPNLPSEFDREWAIPWYSYLITRVNNGQAVESKSWRLLDDRSGFSPEDIIIPPGENSGIT